MRLLCQFEPAAVLPFLQSHDSYRYAVVPLILHLLRFNAGMDARGSLRNACVAA